MIFLLFNLSPAVQTYVSYIHNQIDVEILQGTDRYLEIPSMPVTADQDKENSELTPPLDIFSDVDETDHHDDDEKSVDMFFEDISLSLIDIRKDRTSSSLDCKSIISNPLENMWICVFDCINDTLNQ